MNNYYSDQEKLYVAVDCIIFGFDEEGLKILLIKRGFEPGKGKWSLMGGFLRRGESLDQSANRILNDLTGLENIYLEQLYTYGEIDRDPGERVISVAYFSIIKTELFDHQHNEKYEAKWFGVDSLPRLIFDHEIMVERAIRRLRRRAATEPIGFELLPEMFTLPQLQKLYEAIYQQEIDKRNFRKKIFALNIIKKLPIKEKSSSKKGAFFYRFDHGQYKRLLSSGEHFGL